MSWANVKALSKSGAEIGGHTEKHRDLTSINDDEELYRTIKEDKEIIEGKIDSHLENFAYPFGLYNEAAVMAVKRVGYSYAFTSDSGYLEDSKNPLLLMRTNIGLRPPISVCAAAQGWLDVVSSMVKYFKHRLKLV